MGEANGYGYVLLIETASNQRTIFHTNRERENIGASQLVHEVGTTFVRDTVADPDKRKGALDILELHENVHVKTAVSVSGKAIILTKTRAAAENIIETVTLRAHCDCPGVVARGAIAEIKPWSAKGLDEAIARAHHRHADLAAELPSAAARFPALPFVQTCESSGYPAAAVHPDSQLASGGVSTSSLAKWRAGEAAWKRVATEALLGVEMFRKMHEFAGEDIDGSWIGVVHADGNGLGQVFLSFSTYLKDPDKATAEDYLTTLNLFSNEIDKWTKAAAKKAIEHTWPEKVSKPAPPSTKKKRGRKQDANIRTVPILPVVLGGDDLTVVCEGERAVRFAAAYLRAFEDESARWLASEEGKRLPKLRDQGRVAAAAGVAIVKRNFPFYRAYELAEELMRSAKTAKTEVSVPCSALDFHVLFDSSSSRLDVIRERMKASSGERLTMRPYVVTSIPDLAGAATEGLEWAKRRHYRDGCPSLHCAIEALLKSPERGDKSDTAHLPRSQAHALHNALYQGPAIADARMGQIEHRYGEFPWSVIARMGSLFVKDNTTNDPDGKGAYLLDAMELADIGKEHGLDNSGKLPSQSTQVSSGGSGGGGGSGRAGGQPSAAGVGQTQRQGEAADEEGA